MPKFLFRGSYTAAGAAGVLKDGGSGRAAAVEALVKSLGGTVESNYWAFGEDDFFIVVDLPDAAAAAAASLTVGASGAVRVTTTQLMSASDLDEVTRRSVDYRPPGA
ncbi:hypothetical protein BH24CHL9_BH24CHL9_00710 [soil metagenome]